jgi:hypothetical protein
MEVDDPVDVPSGLFQDPQIPAAARPTKQPSPFLAKRSRVDFPRRKNLFNSST